eukprot:gene9694-11902_t
MPSEEKDFDIMLELGSVALGNLVSRSLFAATYYGIPDQVENGPKSYGEIAKTLNINPDVCYRVMRLLSMYNIFHEEEEYGVFSKTKISSILTKSEQGFAREYILSISSNLFYSLFDGFLDTVKNGKTDSNNMYSELAKDPELLDNFTVAMTKLTTPTVETVVVASDFSKFNTVVDLGGSEGLLLRTILKKNPNIKEGINVELSPIIEHNKTIKREGPEMERYKEIVGDFFESVPKADCYTMKHIVHNWSDEKLKIIFQNIAKSINPNGGRVYVYDFVTSSRNEKVISNISDLLLLQLNGGKERSIKQWEKLADEIGFKIESYNNKAKPGMVVLSKI